MSPAILRRWGAALSAAVSVHLGAAWLILAEAPVAAGGGGRAGVGIAVALNGGPPPSAGAQAVAPAEAMAMPSPAAQTMDAQMPAVPVPPPAAVLPIVRTAAEPSPAPAAEPARSIAETVQPTDAGPVPPPQPPTIAPAPAREAVAMAALDPPPERAGPAPDPRPVDPLPPPPAAAPSSDPTPAWVSAQVPLPPLPAPTPDRVQRPYRPPPATAAPTAPPATVPDPRPDLDVAEVPPDAAGGSSSGENGAEIEAGAAAIDGQGGAGSVVSPALAAAAQASYVAMLQAHLARHKQYPDGARTRRQEGVVMLYFAIDRQGNLVAARVTATSGHALLDQAALDMVARAVPFPAMPAEMALPRLELVVPVHYALN